MSPPQGGHRGGTVLVRAMRLPRCRRVDPSFERTILIRNKLDKYYKDLTTQNINDWLALGIPMGTVGPFSVWRGVFHHVFSSTTIV